MVVYSVLVRIAAQYKFKSIFSVGVHGSCREVYYCIAYSCSWLIRTGLLLLSVLLWMAAQDRCHVVLSVGVYG